MLTEAGAVVTKAENGKAALELFKNAPENSFDIILMDVMDAGDGWGDYPREGAEEVGKDIRTLKNPANCAELLIVTKPDLRPAFDDFLEFKSRDFKVALADTGQIISEFGGQSGMDEQIREFFVLCC